VACQENSRSFPFGFDVNRLIQIQSLLLVDEVHWLGMTLLARVLEHRIPKRAESPQNFLGKGCRTQWAQAVAVGCRSFFGLPLAWSVGPGYPIDNIRIQGSKTGGRGRVGFLTQ
jgi:hypothetical protein